MHNTIFWITKTLKTETARFLQITRRHIPETETFSHNSFLTPENNLSYRFHETEIKVEMFSY
jgi:hypothetical protein